MTKGVSMGKRISRRDLISAGAVGIVGGVGAQFVGGPVGASGVAACDDFLSGVASVLKSTRSKSTVVVQIGSSVINA